MEEETPEAAPKKEKKQGRAKKWTTTLVSFIALAIALIAAYYAITYLIGSDYNIDTLIHGSKTTKLP